MATSPHLGITHLTEAQSQKHATVNTAIDAIDNSLHDWFDVAVDDDGDTDIGTDAEFQQNGLFDVTGALTSAENINLSASIERGFLIRNSTTGGYTVTVQVTGGGGAGVDIEVGVWYYLYSDGTDVHLISKSAPNQLIYGGFAIGNVPPFSNSQLLLYIPVVADVTFPANFAGSRAELQTATTATTTFVVSSYAIGGGSKTTIGTIVFTGAAAKTATFTTSGGTAKPLTAGMVLGIDAPASADATADKLGFGLVADRD
jgi:hypothetical protein